MLQIIKSGRFLGGTGALRVGGLGCRVCLPLWAGNAVAPSAAGVGLPAALALLEPEGLENEAP